MLKENSGHWQYTQRRQCLLQAVMTEVSGNKVPVASYCYISIHINKADCLANNLILQVMEHVGNDAASKN